MEQLRRKKVIIPAAIAGAVGGMLMFAGCSGDKKPTVIRCTAEEPWYEVPPELIPHIVDGFGGGVSPNEIANGQMGLVDCPAGLKEKDVEDHDAKAHIKIPGKGDTCLVIGIDSGNIAVEKNTVYSHLMAVCPGPGATASPTTAILTSF